MKTYVLAVAHWLSIEGQERVLADIRLEISNFIGERSTGIVALEFSDTADSGCIACERNDRREWTEPEEHTCAKRPLPPGIAKILAREPR